MKGSRRGDEQICHVTVAIRNDDQTSSAWVVHPDVGGPVKGVTDRTSQSIATRMRRIHQIHARSHYTFTVQTRSSLSVGRTGIARASGAVFLLLPIVPIPLSAISATRNAEKLHAAASQKAA